MNLEQLHCDILQLKLQRAEIIVRKNQLIKMQLYEAVANERDSERLILKDLEKIREDLEHYDSSLDLNGLNLRRKQEIRNLLIEIQPVDHSFTTDSLTQIEKEIFELKQKRNTCLSNKDQESAEPLIIKLNELMKLRKEIDYFIQQRAKI
jgi:hypothetical protein